MTNNELLLAMTNVLDKKLEPINSSVQRLENEMIELKGDVAELKSDMAEVKNDVAELKGDVAELKSDMAEVKSDVEELKGDVTELKKDMYGVKGRLKRIELMQENEMLPRLRTIENCYTSTHYRYANGINQLEAIQTDVDILKIVVSEHSEKLQKIS